MKLTEAAEKRIAEIAFKYFDADQTHCNKAIRAALSDETILASIRASVIEEAAQVCEQWAINEETVCKVPNVMYRTQRARGAVICASHIRALACVDKNGG